MEDWISSSVFPFVSGTTFATNSTVRAHDPENTKNVPETENIHYHMVSGDEMHSHRRPYYLSRAYVYDMCASNWDSLLPVVLQLIKKLKVYETAQAPSQFTRTTRLPARPFICIGKICSQSRRLRKTCHCNLWLNSNIIVLPRT